MPPCVASTYNVINVCTDYSTAQYSNPYIDVENRSVDEIEVGNVSMGGLLYVGLVAAPTGAIGGCIGICPEVCSTYIIRYCGWRKSRSVPQHVATSRFEEEHISRELQCLLHAPRY